MAHVWNVTQAVLRKASIDVEKCLLALCATLAVSVPLIVLDMALLGERSARPLPALFVLCGIIYALLVAAMVSEKCVRIPAFINAISFGPGTDRTRQLVALTFCVFLWIRLRHAIRMRVSISPPSSALLKLVRFGHLPGTSLQGPVYATEHHAPSTDPPSIH